MQALGSSAKVNEILLTGKVLSGEEAYNLGIVNQLADDAKAEAYALAKEVARQNPLAVRTMIQTLRAQQDHGLQVPRWKNETLPFMTMWTEKIHNQYCLEK